MIAAGMPIIMLSIMNATRRKSQWFISNCELLPVDIFSSLTLFQRNSLLSLTLFSIALSSSLRLLLHRSIETFAFSDMNKLELCEGLGCLFHESLDKSVRARALVLCVIWFYVCYGLCVLGSCDKRE